MRFIWVPRQVRHAVVLAFCLTLSIPSRAQNFLDPIFSTVPFDRWLAASDHIQIPFKGDAAVPALGSFQRLRLTMNITVDGREIAKRPASGRLLMFLQFTDSARHIYQGHGEVDLKEVTATIKQADLVYSHSLLVVPGDYQVAMAVFDTETGEHGLIRKTLHVPPLKEEPLPEAWRGLPPVEFLTAVDPPDVWFQPSLMGRLHLPLETRSPVRIELLMILPGEHGTGDYHNRMMSTLVPSLKTLSQMDVRNGSLLAAVLDLTRRRVSYEQSFVASPASPRDLDWSRLSAAFGDANPGVIDVGSLENRGKSLEFFLKEMGRRIQSGESKARALDGAGRGAREPATAPPRHTLVILSGPVEFASGTDIHQIDLDENPGVDVYYFRFHVTPDRRPAVMIPPNRGGGRRGGGGRFPPGDDSRLGRYTREGEDSLEGTLKPLTPHLFDIKNPEEFRKALASMLEEIAHR
jgi:hypothetical protein